MTFPVARLHVRWHGRALGALVLGTTAVEAIAAGVATAAEVTIDPERIISTTPNQETLDATQGDPEADT